MNGGSAAAEPVGSLDVALAHAVRLLEQDPRLAAEQAGEILKAVPGHPNASLLLGMARRNGGDPAAALSVLAPLAAAQPRWVAAHFELGLTLGALGRGEDAHEHPTDIAAIRMFAEVAARLGRYHDAENLLARCLELAPGFAGARHNYAVALYRQGKHAAALPQVEQLRAAEPANPNYRSLEAAVLAGIGEYARSIDIYAEVLRRYPNQAKIWLSYGHALKTAGRSSEGIRAYRRTLELDPGLGEAWWSLANLKTFRFTAEELRQMQTQLARTDLKTEDRYHFHFALGKSLEDQQDYGSSFEHYRQGNGLRRAQIHYDPAEGREHLARARTLFTREFFAARDRQGAPDPDPIFIVGLPRSGSTLVEQILASHSLVEGTQELPDIITLARRLGGRARRASAKQHFARGQNFTYDLAELGAYYRSYVELMAHFDAVLPGRVHRVFYERMIEDTEGEVRRLLEYCRLPFEPACLRFYENERAVRTASSEQVRTPIYREGLEQWGHYEPWLGALKAALGSVLEAYPATPDFHSH
ncbi:MAG: tetratricopeptide repeat protein [Gammaproteobacteria bacterium]|nr:MAG: tetratricopeptide repeat protein [Gammaproteobacteria bacterium]